MQTEGKKSLRAIAEEAFYVKLGPLPAFPPDPAETGHVKPNYGDSALNSRNDCVIEISAPLPVITALEDYGDTALN
jgi:hypothetical protein